MYVSADLLHQQNNKNKLLLKIAIFQELFLSSLLPGESEFAC